MARGFDQTGVKVWMNPKLNFERNYGSVNSEVEDMCLANDPMKPFYTKFAVIKIRYRKDKNGKLRVEAFDWNLHRYRCPNP